MMERVNLPDVMNDQQIFDHAVNHLRAQGKKAIAAGGSDLCVYRAPNGLECAAGCLIKDEEYHPWMEKHSLMIVLCNHKCPDSLRKRLYGSVELVGKLQKIHDHHGISNWEISFQQLAKKFSLRYSAPEKS